MQGQGMSGERRPVCEGRTHWRSGDKVTDDGSHETVNSNVLVYQSRLLLHDLQCYSLLTHPQ